MLATKISPFHPSAVPGFSFLFCRKLPPKQCRTGDCPGSTEAKTLRSRCEQNLGRCPGWQSRKTWAYLLPWTHPNYSHLLAIVNAAAANTGGNQLFVTLWTVSMSCSVHGILQASTAGVGCHLLLKAVFPTQGSDLRLCIAGRFSLSHREAPVVNRNDQRLPKKRAS